MGLRSVGQIKDTTVIQIKEPGTGRNFKNVDGTPMTITLHGPYSARYKTENRMAERELAETARGMDEGGLTEAIEQRSRDTLLACIEDWSLTLDTGPKAAKIPFSPETAAEVFLEFPWLVEQVERAFSKIANFLETRPAD